MVAKFGTNASGATISWRDNSSYRLYTLGPLCLWQCFFNVLFKIFLRKCRACLCTTFGHTVNGSVRGSAEEVFNRVKNQRNNSLFLRTIQLFGEETEIIVNTGDLAMGISRPYYPENILNIPLNRLEGIQKSQMIAVGFENLEKHGVEKVKFRLLDSSLVTR